jgi:peptidoglycan/LPS O-acetylase OafA/YrhL
VKRRRSRDPEEHEGEAAASGLEEADGSPALRHEPALDGLRGLAILAVLLYHGALSVGEGGYFGVEAFFVLSGFLITSLLLAEWTTSRTIRLGRFWARRARRLLPALFCVVAAVAIQQAIVGPNGAIPDFRMDGISTIFYFANWHQIATGTGYFATTALPSPLQHTWSLAIEEQFYLVWPLLLLGVLTLANRRGHRRSRGLYERTSPAEAAPRLTPLLVLTLVGAVASAVEMGVLYRLGTPLERIWIYFGTDTRSQGLLSGASLAVVLAILRARRRHGAGEATPPRRRLRWAALQVGGLAGLACLLAAVLFAPNGVGRLYEGGFLGVDAAVVLLIASFVARGGWSVTRSVFSAFPLRATGVISYGLYLWHYPLFVWLDDANTGLAGWRLFGLRVGASFAAAVLSYFLVEQPIRQRRLPVVVTRVLGALGLSGALAAVMVAGSVAAAVPLPPPPLSHTTTTVSVKLTGKSDVRCRVLLPVASFLKVYATFHTCPPVRVLLIGDSVGQSLGFQLALNEESYGVVIDNAAMLGCGFIQTGEVGAAGSWSDMDPPCYSADETWARQARSFRPQVVIVEMGWWDSMDHLINDEDVALGEPSFDDYLVARMDALVDAVDAGGAKVVFLSVPWMLPPPWPNGEEMPAALSFRHDLVNALLRRAAADRPGRGYYFDIGPEVTPANHFQADVGGSICRTSDGIHFYWGGDIFKVPQTYCGARLQAALLPYVRALVPSRTKQKRLRNRPSPP